jgi:hypothetical protein
MTLRLSSHYIDTSGKQAFAGTFRSAGAFEGTAARVTLPDGRIGLIDAHGQALGTPHDFIEPFFEGLARANNGGTRNGGSVRGGAWSLLGTDGVSRTSPMSCDAMLNPHDERATFLLDGRWGFMDLSGRVVVPPSYPFMGVFSEGVAIAATDAGDVYLDVHGNIVLPGPYQEATDFIDGLARVKVDGRWGIIDRSGAFVHPPTFDKIGTIVGGAAWAVQGGRCSVLSASGVVGSDFDDVQMAKHDGTWPVKRGEQWHLLRPDGQLGGGYERVGAVDNGFAMAKQGGKWAFLRADGSPLTEHRYDDLRSFIDGHAAVRVEGRGWSLLREDGSELPGAYEDVGMFGEGLCPVRSGGRWGYVDRSGAAVVAPSLAAAGRFAHGFAAVQAADTAPITVYVPRPEVRTVPDGGLQHPVYEGCGLDSRLHCIVNFSRALQGPEGTVLDALIAAWEREFSPVFANREVARDHISVIVTQVADPVRALSILLASLEEALPVSEVITSRWEHPEGQRVAAPVADPRARGVEMVANFDTFDAYWDAAWSEAGPIPVPENDFYLKGAFFNRDRKVVLEQRGMPVWFPDVRVCFGALSGNSEEYLPIDAEGEALYQALCAAFEARFANAWGVRIVPLPGVRSGEDGVELMRYRGRTGYSFALGCEALLQWHAPSVCRYREPEALAVLREVVLARGLAPMIMWRRFHEPIPGMRLGTPSVMVVNLWKR